MLFAQLFVATLPALYLLSVVLSLPVALHTFLHDPGLDPGGPWAHVVFCIEDWRFGGEADTADIHAASLRHVYSAATVVGQLFAPLASLGLAYALIFR